MRRYKEIQIIECKWYNAIFLNQE